MSSTDSCAILGTGVHDAFASGSEDWGITTTTTTYTNGTTAYVLTFTFSSVTCYFVLLSHYRFCA
jgi:hypothetical protein